MTTLDPNDVAAASSKKTRASNDQSRALFFLMVLAVGVLALGLSTYTFGLAGLILPAIALVPVSFVLLIMITLG